MKHFAHLIPIAIGIALFSLSFTACDTLTPCGNSKEDFLTNYKNLIEEVQETNPASDSEKWKNYDYRFKQLVEECYPTYQEDLSLVEKVEFIAMSSQYYVERYEEDVTKSITVNMDAVGKTLKKEYDKLMAEKGDDIEELAEEFGEDVEKMAKKWSKKLEELFED